MSAALVPGEVAVLAPGVRRLLAPNPGVMTGPGTNTYLLGEREVAVIDPGPPDARHVDAIERLTPAPIKWILVTHTHRDHSPAAALLAQRTGAALIGRPPPPRERQDRSFAPQRVLDDGEWFRTDEFALQALHTPGHASNHLCYRHEALGWVFTGDHVMNGSTVIINPPDGNMRHYLDSLRRLRALKHCALAPGHGALMHEPDAALDWIIAHRLAREGKVFAALRARPDSTSTELLPLAYDDVDASRHGIAERSLLAHLLMLAENGRAVRDGERWRAA